MNNKSDFEAILLDPSKYYHDARAVAAADDLTHSQKMRILRRFEQDARELSTATGENMGGGEESDLNLILQVITELSEAHDNDMMRRETDKKRQK